MKRQASDPLLPTRSAKYQCTPENKSLWASWRQLGADTLALARETARYIMNCEISSIANYDRRLTTCPKPLQVQMNPMVHLNRRESPTTLALYLPELPTQPYLLVCPYQKSFRNLQIHIQRQAARHFHLLCHPDQNPPMH
jgi:hypothetical protein